MLPYITSITTTSIIIIIIIIIIITSITTTSIRDFFCPWNYRARLY